MLEALLKEVDLLKDPEKGEFLLRFFKSGKGEYGEGDLFFGISVPEQRKLARKYKDISFKELESLIASKIHEHRLIALLILVDKFTRGGENERDVVAKFYIKNRRYINNWDLVDLSAPKILGEYLFKKDRSLLHTYAKSNNLWERRIAVLSTFTFIKYGEFKDSLEICEALIRDKHDLIHKATGWMLREIGKKDIATLYAFLNKHYKVMPRTELRYAIERLSPSKKAFYMKK